MSETPGTGQDQQSLDDADVTPVPEVQPPDVQAPETASTTPPTPVQDESAPVGAPGRRTDRLEVWETSSHAQVHVWKYDKRGGEVSVVVAGGGGRIALSTEEREDLNEERAANAEMCVFHNGMLRPVRHVPADAVARFRGKDKAGGHTTEELVAIFEKNGNPFVSAIRKLNEHSLRRVHALLEAGAIENASQAQVAVVTEAMEPYAPHLRQTAADRELQREDEETGGQTPVMTGPQPI